MMGKANKERVYSEEVKAAYARACKIIEDFDPEGLTVLTGNNGSGKSLVRKQLPFAMRDYYGLSDVKETVGMVMSTSMDARTSQNAEWGALSSAMNDTSWIATSQNTLHSIKSLLKAASESTRVKYVVIDEYEIGCSEETILALAKLISDELRSLIDSGKIEGAMIITHSRAGLGQIKYDHFQNVEGMTAEEWLNRTPVPTDLDKLDENELFFYIREMK